MTAGGITYWTPGCPCCSLFANMVKLDSATGDRIWLQDISDDISGTQCNGVAADSSGNIWTYADNDDRLRKWDANGSLLVDVENPIRDGGQAIAVDSSDNVIVCGSDGTVDENVFKLNSNGNLLWATTIRQDSYNVSHVATDENDNVYATSGTAGDLSPMRLYKLDEDGNEEWNVDDGNYSVAVDSEVVSLTVDGDLIVYDLDGVELDRNNIGNGNAVYGEIVIGESGDIWLFGDFGFACRRYLRDGALVWASINVFSWRVGAIDPDTHTAYFGSRGGHQKYAVDKDGNLLWSRSQGFNAYDVTVSADDPVFGMAETEFV